MSGSLRNRLRRIEARLVGGPAPVGPVLPPEGDPEPGTWPADVARVEGLAPEEQAREQAERFAAMVERFPLPVEMKQGVVFEPETVILHEGESVVEEEGLWRL